MAAGTGQPITAAGAEARSSYLEAALDCVVIADASGCVVEFNPAAERTFGYRREEALGRTLAELIVPPSLRERHTLAFARFVETGEARLFGQRLELTGMRADGSEFPVELALSRVHGEPLLVCGALRDLSGARRAEDDLRRLADEQAALRRVATLVARGPTPRQVFASVVEEAARLLDFPLISMVRYEQDGTASVIATSHERPFPIGSSLMLDGHSVISVVRDTGRAARIDDYTDVAGSIAVSAREAGIRAAVGSPIVVDGKTWGAMVAVAFHDDPLPADTDSRLGGFTELVATAISNAQARDDVRQLADEQAALRRVATLVAGEARAEQVFAEMAESAAGVLRVPLIALIRFEPDGMSTSLAHWGDAYPYPPGTRFPPHPGLINEVRKTARPARVDSYADLSDESSTELTAAGIHSGVGVPINVDGKPWGLIAAGSDTERPLSLDTETRLSDFTQLLGTALSNAQARDDLRRLAEEQAALRRVATLVAREAKPAAVFSAVAREVASTLDVPLTAVVRFEKDGTATQVGVWGEENPFPVGTSWPLDEQSVSGLVSRTGQPARVDDYAEISGGIAATLAREAGIHTAVGAPVLVDGKPWGVVMALSTALRPIPVGTEDRLAAFTELIGTAIANAQARDELRELAEEQAALRRVATLVARGTDAHAVFDAVCAETGPLIGASSVNLARFTPDGFNLTMAGWSLRDTHVLTGTRLPLAPDTINGVIQRTVAPARVDSYEDADGELAALIRQRGIRSEVGAPVIVEGQLWGALIAGTDSEEVMPAGAEQRVASFAALIATSVSNATARSELIASRARIVTAGDEARRRLERNLHDGTQQRLVALGLDLQAVRSGIPAELQEARSSLERIEDETDTILEEVRELSRGLHPALLSQGGLGPAVKAMARRSPIQVDLDVRVDVRPSESIETAAYYVISEAITNAAKHSHASRISVTLTTHSTVLQATIEDDGIGGAESSSGSGLIGLIDRVEALDGRFAIESPATKGTRISIELPLAPSPIAEVPRGSHPSRGRAEPSDANLLRAAVVASADALYIVDPQGRIRFLNPAALRILGYEDERQLLGRPSHDTIHYLRADGTPFPAAECPLLRPRVSGETVRVDDDWFVRQDGTLVPVAYSSAPVQLPDGRGAVVTFHDRSDSRSPGTSS